jgi:hypothetical protein
LVGQTPITISNPRAPFFFFSLPGLHKVAKIDSERRKEWEKANNPNVINEDEEVGEKEERGSEFKFKPTPNSSSHIWVAGTFVFVSGSLLNFASVSVGRSRAACSRVWSKGAKRPLSVRRSERRLTALYSHRLIAIARVLQSPSPIFHALNLTDPTFPPNTQYGFAPQSMLASLESVQFVTNILFGKVGLLHELVLHIGAALTNNLYYTPSPAVSAQGTHFEQDVLWNSPYSRRDNRGGHLFVINLQDP